MKKTIIKKHKENELKRIQSIENLIEASPNMKVLMENPYHIIYHIEKKNGNLKEYYTARINDKLRLYLRPIGEYPYHIVEIEKIEFVCIDEKHYGEG